MGLFSNSYSVLLTVSALYAGLATASSAPQASAPALKDGSISYTDDKGISHRIDVGGRCSDLWVAPGGSAIAFIRIDASQPDPFAIEPFIKKSTVFIAIKAEAFAPHRVIFPSPKIDGRTWSVFRDPVTSPDLRTVYFDVPAAGTSAALMSVPATGGTATLIAYEQGYCVMWGGQYNGDLLMIAQRPGRPDEGLVQWYYRASNRRTMIPIGNRDRDGDFGTFVRKWANRYGGTCQDNGG